MTKTLLKLDFSMICKDVGIVTGGMLIDYRVAADSEKTPLLVEDGVLFKISAYPEVAVCKGQDGYVL